MGMVSYVDWGQATVPRLFGKERIAGDIPHHYGLEARTMFVQMLINHLKERERQKNHNIPWIEQNNSIHKEDDNFFSTNFMSDPEPEEVIPVDKRQMYDAAVSIFCETCKIGKNSTISCEMRRNFVHIKYKKPHWE